MFRGKDVFHSIKHLEVRGAKYVLWPVWNETFITNEAPEAQLQFSGHVFLEISFFYQSGYISLRHVIYLTTARNSIFPLNRFAHPFSSSSRRPEMMFYFPIFLWYVLASAQSFPMTEEFWYYIHYARVVKIRKVKTFGPSYCFSCLWKQCGGPLWCATPKMLHFSRFQSFCWLESTLIFYAMKRTNHVLISNSVSCQIRSTLWK